MRELAGDTSADRREFLKLLGASFALAGASGCSGPPAQEIVPWIRRPPGVAGSDPQFYASTLRCGGDVLGVRVETHEGRPTKIEGNPLHPASLGATNPMAQAAVLDLWDPGRSQGILRKGAAASWDDFLAEVNRIPADASGLHVLSGRVDSPTLAAQRQRLLGRYPGSHWYEYESIDNTNSLEGARLAFGAPLGVRYRMDRADVIVSLEADFLGSMPGHVRYARDFAASRQPEAAGRVERRLYVLEATPSLTGVKADHRWAMASSDIGRFAQRLANNETPLIRELQAKRGRSLILVGPTQPPFVHALAHVLNERLGNAGQTVEYFEWPEGGSESLQTLVTNIEAGQVKTLLILDGNPVYTAPADLRFGERLGKVPVTIHLGLYRDETARVSTWHLPAAHALETWSDVRGYDGSASIVQPVIAPLYGGHSAHEVIAALLGPDEPNGLDLLERTWPNLSDQALRRGFIEGSAPAAREVRVNLSSIAVPEKAEGLELLFRPDATVWDGRHATNAWLQELPKPITQLTWGNAVIVSPDLAAQHKLRNGDHVHIMSGSNQIEAPIWIVPGQARSSVTVTLGYGRSVEGTQAMGQGFNANRLRMSTERWVTRSVRLTPTGNHSELASTQQHHVMEDVRTPQKLHRSFYAEHPKGEYRWGMAIDLNSCIGCNACTIACQAENNIPVVGADQVLHGREMHWLRVDQYWEGTRVRHQPVACQHCDHAPCELVCPVGATVHDSEGLNLQVYNRCIGTRFCSNNCPYKVRRFNFLQYSDLKTESLEAQRNPEVTVRNRGVMEKCTYCIQRIEKAHITADREGRRIQDGEVVTACQEVCPTRAIVFGDTSDPDSTVSRAKKSERNYALLEDLNTRPQTTYLKEVPNPNPLMKDDV